MSTSEQFEKERNHIINSPSVNRKLKQFLLKWIIKIDKETKNKLLIMDTSDIYLKCVKV